MNKHNKHENNTSKSSFSFNRFSDDVICEKTIVNRKKKNNKKKKKTKKTGP